MHSELRLAFDHEIALSRKLIAQGDLERAFSHLERAHVLGQRHVMPHAQSHWLMLGLELRRRRFKAVAGQAVRFVLGIAGSVVGLVPVGNTGGTDISMFKRLPVAPDLQAVIQRGAPERS